MPRKVVFLPDLTNPGRDDQSLQPLLTFLADFRPDCVIHFGRADADVAEVLSGAAEEPAVFLGEPGREIHRFAPGWVALSGPAEGVSDCWIPGNTGLRTAKKLGSNVVLSHTRRLGRGSESRGANGEITRTITGVEIGHLRDLGARRSARVNRCQQGFAIARVDGEQASVEPITVTARGFTVDGNTYVRTRASHRRRRSQAAASA